MSNDKTALVPAAASPLATAIRERLDQRRFEILAAHGVPEELFETLVKMQNATTRARIEELLKRVDVTALRIAIDAGIAAELATLTTPCAGGCGRKLAGAALTATCPDCVRREARVMEHRLARRGIDGARARASAARLPSTLTEQEWDATVAHFDNACAYCGLSDWFVVDFATPIELGGGATRDNCVPACHRCSSAKGRRRVEDLLGAGAFDAFDPRRLNAIREWCGRKEIP
jgi:hypothetical protein